MAVAALYCVTDGCALVAPALVTVVVPDVTAFTVQAPAPVFKTVMAVPVGKLYVASVGIKTSFADALVVITKT